MADYLEIQNGEYNKRYEFNYKMSYGIGAEHLIGVKGILRNPWVGGPKEKVLYFKN